jgi:hypothetical protein
MSKILIVTAAFAGLLLAGCSETTSQSSGQDAMIAPAMTGGDLTGVPAIACKNAIAKQANISPRDVAVFDVSESEAATVVMATIAGATAPWKCFSDRNGRVSGVEFTGSEGRL